MISLQRSFHLAVLSLLAASHAQPVEPGQLSKTSLVTLQLRALGAKLPDRELRNPDNLASSFLGEEERALLQQMPGGVYADLDFETAWKKMPEIYRRVFLQVLARTRLIDDALGEALSSGVRQVVILGAGYDSRAYRFRAQLRDAVVFELDLPASQQYKKERLQGLFGHLPRNVRFVPIDFAEQDLGEELHRAGYRTDLRTFFIWEGVTMYIPESAVAQTLQFVAAASSPGSRIVFDYEHEKAIRGDHDDEVLKASNARLAKMGEPHVFGFRGGSAGEFVRRLGLEVVSDVSPREVTARYLTRRDGSTLGEERWSNGICIARVPVTR